MAGFGDPGKKKNTVVMTVYMMEITFRAGPNLPKPNSPPDGNLSRPTAINTAMGIAYEIVRAMVLTLKMAERVVLEKRYRRPMILIIAPWRIKDRAGTCQ
jgi:hypothetical protein